MESGDEDDNANELSKQQKKLIEEQFKRCEKHLQEQDDDNMGSQKLMRNDQIFSLMRLCSGNNHMTKEECLLFIHRIHLQNKGNLQGGVDKVNRSADVARDRGASRSLEQN